MTPTTFRAALLDLVARFPQASPHEVAAHDDPGEWPVLTVYPIGDRGPCAEYAVTIPETASVLTITLPITAPDRDGSLYAHLAARLIYDWV